MRVSKFVKAHKDILLEYIYDDNSNIGESYQILVNIKNNNYSYIAGTGSSTYNTLSNQLFPIDLITNNYGLINTTNYSFLQLKDYAAGFPLRHDTLKIHLPVNYTFGENIGCYVKIYTFDYDNKKTYDLSNFYFDLTNVEQSYLLNYTSPAFLFQEKLWGKNITISFPSPYAVSNQRVNNSTKIDTVNSNLTQGSGLSLTSPIFIDFSFITTKKTVNKVTTYYLSPKTPISLPQSPDFEKLGVKIEHSLQGDYFEIYGIYNGNISEFNDFINNSVQLGNRYYVEYTITLYEQNIRGKSIKITQTNNFNEKIEYRPIIKYSTTTAIIDVEMNVIDSVDNSSIYRQASYGMLQDEVSKYSLNLTKINLANANKPKIYNIKNPQGAGIFSGTPTEMSASGYQVVLEPVKVNYTVLADRFNVVAKSDSVKIGKTTFFGLGKLQILIQPFDNVIQLIIAQDVSGEELAQTSSAQTELVTAPKYMDMTNMGEIKMIIKNTQLSFESSLYMASNQVDLANGVVVFKIPASRINDIRKIHDSGNNLFYVTGTLDTGTTVIYSGLYTMFDSPGNISDLTLQSNQLSQQLFVIEQSAQTQTAVVTVKVLPEGTQQIQSNIAQNITSNSSTTNYNSHVYTINTDSSLVIDGYTWNATQLKTVLSLDSTANNLTMKDGSLYSNNKYLDKLDNISKALQKNYLSNTDVREVYNLTVENFQATTAANSNVAVTNISLNP